MDASLGSSRWLEVGMIGGRGGNLPSGMDERRIMIAIPMLTAGSA